MPITTNCAEDCPLIDFTIQTIGDRLTPAERMEYAVLAVTTDGMSQRAAAKKFGVARRTLGDYLQRVGETAHPATSQSQPEVQPIQPDQQPIQKLTSNERQKGLRQLGKQNGLRTADLGNQGLYDLLLHNGVAVPDHLTTPKLLANHTPKTDDTTKQGLQVNNHVSLLSHGAEQADTYVSEIDNSDAVRDEVCQQVQDSNRPTDFKRAILILAELDAICTEAYYRRHPEPWVGEDWTHLCSEVEIIRSLVRQRAQEACEDALLARNAVTVTAAAVA